jgi:Family of unknown function (DUF6600)
MMYPGALRRIVLAGAVALLALASGMLVPDEAKAGGPVAGGYFEIDQFYDELAPYGDWVYHPNHDYVWLPRSVAPDWRPFTVGNWIYTEEYGWYWQSYEPFAWAVYHYGRWGFEPEYGWYWVPGDTWAPAWVQWRYGNEYVGWAPEAPTPTRGYAYGGPARYAPPPPRESWVFVEPRYLTSPAVRTYAVPRNSLTIAFSRTTYVNRPLYRDGYVYNYGMPRDHWSRVTHRHLEPRKIYRGNHRGRPANWNRNRRDVYVYAPGVRKGARPRKPPKKIAHKPNRTKAHAKAAKARNARLNRAAGFKPPNPLGPRGVMNPNYRGPGASGGHAIGNYKAFEGRKPPQAKAKAVKRHKPNAKSKSANAKSGKSKSARSNSARSNSARPSTARAAAQRNRAMSLAPPTNRPRPGTMSPNYRGPGARGHNPTAAPKAHGNRPPPQVRRTPPKPQGAKPQGAKPQGAKAKASKKASKSKASKPQARAGGGNGSKPAAHRASRPKPSNAAKARANKPRTAYAKPQFARGQPKPKASKPRSAKPQSATSRAAHAKPKAKPKGVQTKRANAKRSNVKSGPGGGNRKHGANRGGDRAKACKANPKRPGCGGRG